MTDTPPSRPRPLSDFTNLRAPLAIHPEIVPLAVSRARAQLLVDPADVAPLVTVTKPEAARRPEGGRIAGGVAVIRISGAISARGSWLAQLFGGGGGLISLQEAIAEAVTSSDVAGIVLDIDSPGGGIDLLPETAAMVREARAVKPVVAVANTMAASAAYWLAAQADEILISPSGQVGSVGVITMHEEISRLEAEMGYTVSIFTAGQFKKDGNYHEPLSDSAREDIQAKTDEVYGWFVRDVAAGRGVGEGTVRSAYGEGRMFYATEAIDRGMAEAIGTVEDAVVRVTSGDVRKGSRSKAEVPTPSSSPRGGGDTQQGLEQRQRAASVLLS